jgi:xanthine/uracil/vitamin C permease (AzgA family)
LNRWLDQFFELAHHQTTVRREVVAGLTTFFTMAYIVTVNPAILKTAGMPAGASLKAFGVIVLMAFTYNVGIGMTAGFILYPFCKLVSGRLRDVRQALWGLTALSLLFFVFYPYT